MGKEEEAEDACRCHGDPRWKRLEPRVGFVQHLVVALHPDPCHCLHPQIKLKYFFKLAPEKKVCMKDIVLLKLLPFKKNRVVFFLMHRPCFKSTSTSFLSYSLIFF